MKRPRRQKVTVVQDPEEPVETEILAEAIVGISNAIKKLRESDLNDRAIVVLINASLPSNGKGGKVANLTTIRAVLDAIEELKENYCR